MSEVELYNSEQSRTMKTVFKLLILLGILAVERAIGLPVLFMMLAVLWLSPLPFLSRLGSSLFLSFSLALMFFLSFSLSWLILVAVFWLFAYSKNWLSSLSLRLILIAGLSSIVFFFLVAQPFQLGIFLYFALAVLLVLGLLKSQSWSKSRLSPVIRLYEKV